jgi:lipopolysaccharide biosynthesis glycosyltransferase
MKEIPVFFTFDRYYVVAAGVAIYSLLKHASPNYDYKLYILHRDIPPSARKKLLSIVNRFSNAVLEFIDTSSFDRHKDIPTGKAHFSKEIYYKLIAAELFPQYDYIICSDVDVVFRGDISPSYSVFKDDFFYFAGVGQIVENGRMDAYKEQFTKEEQEVLKKEIAAGYLLINLKTIRENQLQERLTQFYIDNYYRLYLPEQDCIVLCCWPHIKHLPMEYVVCNSYYRLKPDTIAFYTDNDSMPLQRTEALAIFTHALTHPVQLHYVGANKPWNSFFVPKQSIWFAMLYESECVALFLKSIPTFILKRMRRYSLKRFLSKMRNRIST